MLLTGSTSSLAGIGHAYIEALVAETGLSPAEIEAAFGELEKKPTPTRSFVVREGSVVGVRDALADDPARGEDPDIRNPKHLTAIDTILGSLPRGSVVVKKFRAYYKLNRPTASRGARESGRVAGTVCDTACATGHSWQFRAGKAKRRDTDACTTTGRGPWGV
jgi:hypothetical protein